MHRALFDIGGWAAYARYLVWESELYGGQDDTLVELLAIRIGWGYALFKERTDTAFREAWREAMEAAAALPRDEQLGDDPELAVDLILQHAYEHAYQRRLVARLVANMARPQPEARARRPLQAAFCIDVRSEIYRRALETVCPEAETVGFAGFFGFPIEYIPIGRVKGGAQCPVLLTPAFTVCEHVKRASAEEETEVLGLRLLRRRAAKAWKSFKLSAVSSFTYVETMGLAFAPKILSDTLGLTRPVDDPNADGLDRGVIGRIGPSLEPREVGGRATGFDGAQRVAMAEAVLRAMSMTGDFARLVLLAGHGSSTVNNPHASGLDCGACGGHTGEANARVAAAILNDAGVREGLVARGITIPADTWFIGCLHDTTTDEIRLHDVEDVPASHGEDLARLEEWLAKASDLARMERATLLGLPEGAAVDRQVRARSRDWSQVRPEWGLAGNAAFIAAPRARSQGLELGGRSFLHSYDWRQDEGFKVLELIMTAPMVVASWINLQYYGSTVNNRAFGAGNKVLHNVVGQLGVLEGNAGDLKVGLPWQSVHDGRRFVHEPLRLNAFIEAPRHAIDAVIAKHAGVRDLLDNGWLHLWRIAEAGTGIERYLGGLRWETATFGAVTTAGRRDRAQHGAAGRARLGRRRRDRLRRGEQLPAVPGMHLDLDPAVRDGDQVVGIGLVAAAGRGRGGGMDHQRPGRNGSRRRLDRGAVAARQRHRRRTLRDRGVAAGIGQMEVPGQDQLDAVRSEGRQRPGGAAGVGVRRQRRRGRFGQEQRVVDHDDPHQMARHRLEPRQGPLELAPPDPPDRPVQVPGQPPRRLDPDDAELRVAPGRLEVGVDVAPVAPVRIGEAGQQVPGRQVVVAGHREHRRRQPVEKGPRGQELAPPGALGEIARHHHEVGRRRRERAPQALDHVRVDPAEMQVRDVRDAPAHGAAARRPGFYFATHAGPNSLVGATSNGCVRATFPGARCGPALARRPGHMRCAQIDFSPLWTIGRVRTRWPVAAKIALHRAGAKGGTPGSPTPPGGASLSTRCTSIALGELAIRATG